MNTVSSSKDKEGSSRKKKSSSRPSEKGDPRKFFRTASASKEDIGETVKPEFYFEFDDINKISVKVSSKCLHIEAVEFLEKHLTAREIIYLSQKSPLRHIFHMKKKQTLKMILMVALVNRAVKTKKDNELWFIINGVPIRYSLWEHALLSGLNCSALPKNWEKIGGLDFYIKHFGKEKYEKVLRMEVMRRFIELSKSETEDRLKMAYLILLSYVIGHHHTDYINPFLLKIVNDLKACEAFPWGRFTFENVVGFVHNYLNGHRTPVSQWNLPGFIIPLTMLPFECIPKLRQHGWYNDIKLEGNILRTCPRMCRRCFIPNKKYGIKQGLAKMGRTQNIDSILMPTEDELHLIESVEYEDNVDEMIDSWIDHLQKDPKCVRWKDILEDDVKSRTIVPMMKKQNKRKAIVSVKTPKKKRGKTSKEKRKITEEEEEDDEDEEEEEDQDEEEGAGAKGDGVEVRRDSESIKELKFEVNHLKEKIEYLSKEVDTQKKLLEEMKKVVADGINAVTTVSVTREPKRESGHTRSPRDDPCDSIDEYFNYVNKSNKPEKVVESDLKTLATDVFDSLVQTEVVEKVVENEESEEQEKGKVDESSEESIEKEKEKGVNKEVAKDREKDQTMFSMEEETPGAAEIDVISSDDVSDEQKQEQNINISPEGALYRRAEMYQEYMKQIPIPTNRGSLIPFTTWVGLGDSIKQLYGQPLHYLTNILLHQWDRSSFGSEAERQALDTVIHPSKAEAAIWLVEEIHRSTSSYHCFVNLWQSDPMYHAFIDPIYPKL